MINSCVLGARLVVKTLAAIENGDVPSTPQNSIIGELNEAPKIFKETCKIDWNKPADDVFNLIRGLSPYPTAFTTLFSGDDEIGLKIFSVRKTEERKGQTPGTLTVEGQSLFIACSDGSIEVLELQMAGKKRMETRSFLLGFNLDGYIVK